MIDWTCQCPADGYCAVLKRQMQGRQRSICNGTSGLPETGDGDTRENYVNLWKGLPPEKAASTACAYRGEHTGDWLSCETCPTGKVQLKIFGCQLHSLCTIGKSSVRDCRTCQSRLEPEGKTE